MSCAAICTVAMPSAPSSDARRTGADVGGVGGGGAAPANQPVAVTHLAGRGVSPGPAEPRRRLVETGHQRARGEAQAGGRISLRVVDAAQLDRVHAQLLGQLVHGHFKREHVGHVWRRAHEARRVAVGMHHVHAGLDVRAGVHARGRLGAGHVVVRRAGGHLPALVKRRPVSLPESSALRRMWWLRLGAVGGDGVALTAGGDELDRAVQPTRRNGDPGRACRGNPLRAERAADVARHHADALGVQVELLGQRAAQPVARTGSARTRSGYRRARRRWW